MDFKNPSSPNVSALLKIKILSWTQHTGFPVRIRVHIHNRTFNLHQHPFTTKSGYFIEKLQDSDDVQLPPDFPGGADTFEMIALFLYGSSTVVDPFNVAALRCASEYLRMTEEYGPGNLCERFDVYLNQVVLQSWNDTLIVLHKCQSLLPWAEDLLIVSRCIETLAFMACMEILDPERRRDQPVVTMDVLAAKPWSELTLKDVVNQDLWVQDVIALPITFFKRVIGSLRRQGMKEKYVGPIVLFYADRWVISRMKEEDDESSSTTNASIILLEVIDLLPLGLKQGNAIPVDFYFLLLSASIELHLKNEAVENLQRCITPALHSSRIEHFIRTKNGDELCIMQAIFSAYFSRPDCTNHYTVAELWDKYLNRIASESNLSCKHFMNLIETVPMIMRRTHDDLYRAINAFLQSHPNLAQKEKEKACKFLNCRKLSEEVCIEAVQNEVMPLRLIVQALFVQQINTQQAFRDCSDSFRYGEFNSGSLSTATLVESPYVSDGGSRGLKECWSRKEYESTSFRIESLEQELVCLKRRVEEGGKRGGRRKKKAGGNGMQEVGGCVGNVRFGWLLKALQRLSFFRRQSRRKAAGVLPVPASR